MPLPAQADGRTIALVADSTCDLTAAEASELGVVIIPLRVEFQGRTCLDGVDITTEDILTGIANGADLPTTSQVTPDTFLDAFQRAAEGGAEQVLCLTLSSELSGTYASACRAAEGAPLPVTVFDTRATTVGHGDVVRKAAELRGRGASLAAILEGIEPIRDTLKALFAVTSLEHLRRGGRIGRASALLGGLLRVTPILTHEGAGAVPVTTVRGKGAAIREIVRHVRAFVREHAGTLNLTFMHVHDPASAERLARALRDSGVAFAGGAIRAIGTSVATHVGPGTFGVYMHTEPSA